MKRNSVSVALSKIEQAVEQFPSGGRNLKALLQIERTLRTIERSNRHSTTVMEKAGSVRISSELLFTERKHKHFGGPKRLIQDIKADCEAIRQALHALQPATRRTP